MVQTKVRIGVSVDGTNRAANELESVNRALTRTANHSSSAGRAFSSQAKGLGGLVGAYAGAAATAFALQQAFAALKSAAKAESVMIGFEQLSRSVGINGKEILGTIQAITSGQISLAATAENTANAVSGGLGVDQIADLATIAAKSSTVLGRDLTDAYTRLVRGVGKLEPELLDELGIFTRIQPAVDAYSAKIGKAASQLTTLERKQAFANAVIEEGSLKYSGVSTSSDSALTSLNKFVASLENLAAKIGTTFANILTLVTDNLKNLSSAITLLGGLMAGALVKVLSAGLVAGGQQLSTFFSDIADKVSKYSKSGSFNLAANAAGAAAGSITNLTGDSKESKKYLNRVALLATEKSSITEINKLKDDTNKRLDAEAGKLEKLRSHYNKILQQNQEIDRQAQEAIEAKDKYLTAKTAKTGTLTRGQYLDDPTILDKDKKFFRKIVSEHNENLATILKGRKSVDADQINIGATEKTIQNLSKIKDNLDSAAKSTGALANGFFAISSGVTSAAGVISKFGAGSIRWMAGILSAVSILDIFLQTFFKVDVISSVLDDIGTFFQKFIADIKNANQATQAFVATLTHLDNSKFLKEFTAKGLSKAEALAARSKAQEAANDIISSTLFSLSRIERGPSEYTKKTAQRLEAQAIDRSKTGFTSRIDSLKDKRRSATTYKEQLELEAQIKTLQELSADWNKFLTELKVGLDFAGKDFSTFNHALQSLKTNLDLGPSQFTELMRLKQLWITSTGVVFRFSDGIGEIKMGLDDFNRIAEKQPANLGALVNQNALNELNKALRTPAITADNLDQKVKAVELALEKTKKYKDQIKSTDRGISIEAKALSDAYLNQIPILEAAIKTTKGYVNTLQEQERQLKLLNELYNSQLGSFEKGFSMGLFNEKGKIALLKEEQDLNKLNVLLANLDKAERQLSGRSVKQITTEINNLEGALSNIVSSTDEKDVLANNLKIAALSAELVGKEGATNLANLSKKALVGLFFEMQKTLFEINEGEKKRLLTLNAQNNELEKHLTLLQLQQGLQTLQLKQQQGMEILSLNHKILLLDKEIVVANIAAAQAAVAGAITRLNAQKELVEATKTQKDILLDIEKFKGIKIFEDMEKHLSTLEKLDSLFDVLTETGKERLTALKELNTLSQSIFEANSDIRKKEVNISTVEATNKINLQVADKNIEAAKLQAASTAAQKEMNLEKLRQEREVQVTEITNRRQILEEEKKILQATFNLEEEKRKNIEAQQRFEIGLIAERYRLIQQQAIQLDTFMKTQSTDTLKVLASFTPSVIEAAQSGDSDVLIKAINDQVAILKKGFTEVFKDDTALDDIGKKALLRITAFTTEADRLLSEISSKQGRINSLILTSGNERISIEEQHLQKREDLQRTINDRQKKLLEAQSAAQSAADAAALDAADTAKKTAVIAADNAKKQAALDLAAAIRTRNTAEIELAKREALFRLQEDVLFRFATNARKILVDDLSAGLRELNAAAMNGTLTFANFSQGLKDWTYKLVVHLQETLLEEALIKPVTNFVTTEFNKLLGDIFSDFAKLNDPKTEWLAAQITGGTTLTSSTAQIVGAIRMNGPAANPSLGVGNMSAGTASGTMSEQVSRGGTQGAAEIAKTAESASESTGLLSRTFNFFTKDFASYGIALGGTFASILASGGNFKTALIGIFASLFAQIARNLLTSALSSGGGGFGGILSSLFGGSSGSGLLSSSAMAGLSSQAAGNIAGGVALASGGLVRHMASGGLYGRDSTLARLQPGEFVLRKPSVDKMGLQNAQRLNAGGNMNSGDVSVNIVNQGTAQQTEGSPEVKFDGQKMVVDIILKDLENNGPIRRTLRGGKV